MRASLKLLVFKATRTQPRVAHQQTGFRPIQTLIGLSVSGGNGSLTCRSALDGPERQLPHSANSCSRPVAVFRLSICICLLRRLQQPSRSSHLRSLGLIWGLGTRSRNVKVGRYVRLPAVNQGAGKQNARRWAWRDGIGRCGLANELAWSSRSLRRTASPRGLEADGHFPRRGKFGRFLAQREGDQVKRLHFHGLRGLIPELHGDLSSCIAQ